jgi:hypothetical protein
MKRFFTMLLVIVAAVAMPVQKASAQIEIIQEIIKAAIMAVDLGIQKIQTETIYLQDAQKAIENTMQQLHLDDITSWVQKQKDLYGEYYQELWQIKSYITYYQRVKDIIDKQILLVNTYKSAYATFKQNKNFSADEINTMFNTYSGIMDESIKNLDEIYLVINAFSTQMSDGQRLKIIDEAAARIDKNYSDLQSFNQRNVLISLQRAQESNDIDQVKNLYGLP